MMNTLLPGQDGSRPCSESMIILERPLSESKEEDGRAVSKEISSKIIRPEYLNAVADVGKKQILKSADAAATKRPSSAGLTSHKGSGDHKESLYSTGIEGSAVSIVSSVYTPCLIPLGTEQSQPTTEKEFIAVKTNAKRNAMNRNRVQDTMQEHYLQGQLQKPLSLHKNMPPADKRFEGRNVQQISSMPLSSEEDYLRVSPNHQRSLSFCVSSDENHERQRAGSFTGQMEQAEGKREHAFPLIKRFKTQNLHKNSQVRAPGRDPPEPGVTSTPAVLAKPRDLTIPASAGQERKESLANNTREMAVETHEGVEEADEANKRLKMNKVSKEQKEEKSSSEVRLHITSQSEVSIKQYNSEVRNAPWLPETTTPVQKDSKVQPARENCSVPRGPPLYNTQLFSSAETPVFSSIRPLSARRDQERAGLIRFPGKS